MTTISLGHPVLSFVLSTFLSQKHVSDWKPEIRCPHDSEYVVLSGLDWNTEYEVHVVAENQQGKSEPGILSFRTASEPTTIPGTIPIIPAWASTHTHQPQYTKASTVTRKGSITWILDCNQVLIQSSLAVGSDMKHRSLSVCCRSCIVFVLSLLVQLVTKWKNVWYCWREKQGLYHFLKAMNSYMYYFGLFSGFKMRRDSTVSHMWMSTNSEMQTKCFSHE